MADGTPLILRPTTEVTADVRKLVADWVAEDPARGRARWYNNRRQPLEWESDGGRYRPTEIVRRILAEAAGIQRSVRGPAWWVLEDGRDLPTMAGLPERGTFDWSELHELLECPSGRPLDDLRRLGRRRRNGRAACVPERLARARRRGASMPNFRWSDPADTRTQQEALEAEGVLFSDGAADPQQRLDLNGAP